MAFRIQNNSPVFLKIESNTENQIKVLKDKVSEYSTEIQERIFDDIRKLEFHIRAERKIENTLRRSLIPMYILHDVTFKCDDEVFTIDYLVVTRKCYFVIKCADLFGTVNVDRKGNFSQISTYGRKTKEYAIPSPVADNYHKMTLLKKLFQKDNETVDLYRSVVVTTNEKLELDIGLAPTEVQEQIIPVSELSSFINRANAALPASVIELPDIETREIANAFLANSIPLKTDYFKKYETTAPERPVKKAYAPKKKKTPETNSFGVSSKRWMDSLENPENEEKICPKCGSVMIKRIARSGPRAGKSFYGCSNFPTCRYVIDIDD